MAITVAFQIQIKKSILSQLRPSKATSAILEIPRCFLLKAESATRYLTGEAHASRLEQRSSSLHPGPD